MATREAIDGDCCEDQLKRRPASRLEDEDSMNKRLRQERARMNAESDARLLELRRQVEDERSRYEEDSWRKFKIERLQRIARAVDIEVYEAHDTVRVATAELARAKTRPVGVAHRVATPGAKVR